MPGMPCCFSLFLSVVLHSVRTANVFAQDVITIFPCCDYNDAGAGDLKITPVCNYYNYK